ncbi:DUF481 domain-containing protein [Thiomicrorhabdus indica]|uniref:DUF481 domain-containing protein n=1 Tax=Thiomicrorhabdus indica TaxID=2267253 RepID=UPI002AA6A8DC|nr:DUF481 domain-containing protein [Thiomicrorhabdus indica]
MKKIFTLAVLAAAATNAQSAENNDLGFKGNGEFGFTTTSGNTESESLFTALNLKYAREKDEIIGKVEANYQSEDDVTTQERYLIDTQYNRFYSSSRDFYSFASARFEQNEFENIDLDSTYSIGLGKLLFKSDTMSLKGEAGVGYQTTDFTDGTNDDQAVVRGKLDYAYKINENVDFAQDLMVTKGSEQMKTEANTAIKVKLAEQMRLKAGFKYRHNSDPAAGAEKTDTQTLLTLIYDF